MVDPILESYNCKKCDKVTSYFVTRDDDTGLFWYEKKVGRKIHEDKIPEFDGSEEVTYSPDWDDDPTYWHKYEAVYTYDYPDTVKCKHCKKKTEKRASIYYFSVGNGRNSYAAKRERQRYAMDGMDKKQAEQFYKESIEASKERVKSGDQHYKKIVPHYETLEKEGIVKRNNDQETANKIETLKRANQQITKDGTIGRGVRKR
tara:strand:+ start:1111 stop:1719 length:609 start_codon:yes stop_codon:yes gene_type:complete